VVNDELHLAKILIEERKNQCFRQLLTFL